MNQNLTARGTVFWPVGTGDSTTIVVDEEIVVQIDLNDQAQADDPDTPVVAVVDRLAESLPATGPDGMPYLAVFVLTHADLDHCRGFEDLLATVAIGELWVTPRLWREYADENVTLSAPAEAFREEAERRIKATEDAVAAGKEPVSGDRVLIIGYDTDHDEHAYSELPDKYLSGPGKTVTVLDGVDCAGTFEAFLHAPFKDDCAKARNDTSVGLQVTLTDGTGSAKFLLFGDLKHDTLKKIFDYSTAKGRTDRIAWDVLLAPHHCSKYTMYVGGELQQDLLDALEASAKPGARIVSSSHSFRDADNSGDNPPHLKARDRYNEIVDEPVLCTMEHGSADAPAPVVFEVDPAGVRLVEPDLVEAAARTTAKAYSPGRGRLGAVAAEAAEYARQKAQGQGGWQSHTRSAGGERLGQAVAADRGDGQAPSAPIGFGRE
jgi:beta-lactamase superfamily II metal-dependent hydrolase